MNEHATSARLSSPRFSVFIRERSGEILQDWERAVRSSPKARDLDRPALLDHIPDLLDRIAEIADELVAGGQQVVLPAELAERHALERLEEGFDLRQVVAEFAVLRDCIVRLWAAEVRAGTTFDSTGFRALNQAIDTAIAASIDRYTQARDRTLQSLDRLSAAALEAANLDEFLDHLLRVLLETTAAVHTATVLLRQGERLVVRASVGLEPHEVLGFSVRIGEGFAGTIAKTKQPLALRSASTDPLVVSPSLRAKGVKGIYGAPLIDGASGDVIGVAHIGSLTAHEFSAQDKRLLSALAARATAAIYQHLLREAAERSERERVQLLEQAQRALSIETVGVLFFSLDGRMRDANRALERMSGYSREQLCNMDWHVLTPPEFMEVTAHTAEKIATTGEAPPYEKQWIRPDGSRWWALFAPTRLSGTGGTSECVEFIIDISERKRVEHALQEAMRAREEILAVVSHDLKNPLGAIYMAAALLAGKPYPDERARKQVETIQRSASRMDHLIRDLLDMASIQAQRLSMECKPEDPGGLLTEALEVHEPAAKEKGIRIVLAASEFQQRRLSCDRGRVLQVFGNLLGNAIKFCRSDDVITIRGSVLGSNDQAQFDISDTGPGIPDDELPHLFEPYWSARRYVRRGSYVRQGTGLGLYISKGIIDAHEGRFWVESKQGVGTTFSFTLPLLV